MESKKLKELKEKYHKAKERLEKACYECSPTRRKSEFVTCRKCGSRYPKKFQYVPTDDFACCQLCYNSYSLYSATSIKRITNCICKVRDIQKLIDKEEERLKQLAHPNWSKFEISLHEVYNEVEDIFEEDDLGDSVEIYGEIGGDSVHYVIMKEDGAVYEK